MATYKLTIEYEGTAYHGWQIQPKVPTVQETLEHAFSTALRQPVSIVGSGRTDAGVHARGQVAHFCIDTELECYRLCGSVNGILPPDIAVIDIEPAMEPFHARYDARRRRYHYYAGTEARALERRFRVLLHPVPDFHRMNEAASTLLGTHDFSAFCRIQSETENRTCTIEQAVWTREGRPADWRFEMVGNRFLHGMVRSVVGTLLQVGRGKRDVPEVDEILRSGDRRKAGPAAPARGLVLEGVEYE